MSEDFVSHVFDTFSRAEKTEVAQIEGTGLGMAIAKNLVELMGGTITCSSTPNVGTTFTVSLCLETITDNSKMTSDITTDRYQNTRVLILSEIEMICISQINLFRSFHVDADYALNPNDAAAKVELAVQMNHPYQFVIINQSDADKNGIFAMQTMLRSIKPGATKYILAANDFTGINQSSAVDAGIYDFIYTPVFRSTAYNLLNGKKYNRDRHKQPVEFIPDLTGIHLIVAEDNNINREIACQIIAETHADIHPVANGKEALEEYLAHEDGYFNIILMDIQMPLMNGYESTARIRAAKRKDSASIPIFALTANTFDEDVRQVKENGMNGHIGKPYTSEELYRIIYNAIRKD